MRIPLKTGDEFDALTKARKYYKWARGELKRIKRGYNKRFRRTAKEQHHNDDTEREPRPHQGNNKT